MKRGTQGRHLPAHGQTTPQPGRKSRRVLAQRTGSGRSRFGQKRAVREGRRQRVIMDLRPEFCWSDGELGRKIGCRNAPQAVAAARNPVIVPMLVMGWGRFGVVDVLFRTGLRVSGGQMQRGMSIAVGESERQQQHQASDKQRSHKTRRPRSFRNSSLVDSTNLGYRRLMTPDARSEPSGSGTATASCRAPCRSQNPYDAEFQCRWPSGRSACHLFPASLRRMAREFYSSVTRLVLISTWLSRSPCCGSAARRISPGDAPGSRDDMLSRY